MAKAARVIPATASDRIHSRLNEGSHPIIGKMDLTVFLAERATVFFIVDRFDSLEMRIPPSQQQLIEANRFP